MVQALRELINLDNFNEASLLEAFSSFQCVHTDDDPNDVVNFLLNHAISYEQEDKTRTYLILNDEAWQNGYIQIDGYFSIAIKVLNLKSNIIDSFLGFKPHPGAIPAFLIGQLARGTGAPKGVGREYLNTAIGYISHVSDVIGGRFIYLDCKPERQAYYEEQGFSFLQKKKNSDLIQMYMIL